MSKIGYFIGGVLAGIIGRRLLHMSLTPVRLPALTQVMIWIKMIYDTLPSKRAAVYRGSDSVMLGAFNGIGSGEKIDGI